MQHLKSKLKITTVEIQNTPLKDQSLKHILLTHLKQKQAIYQQNNVINQTNPLFNISGNGFFDAFYAAYCLHGDVMISANDIWIVISHNFSQEINGNPEKYRNFFVNHQGKKALQLKVDKTQLDWQNFPSQQNNWGEVIQQFNEQIMEHTKGDIALLMKSDFSHSTEIEVVAANVCLMAQMKSYFSYKLMVCGCGIQNVHFVGGVEDFEYLSEKINKLRNDYQLNTQFSQQLASIQKIVQIFIQQMKDPQKVNLEFWNSIFDEAKGKVFGGSGIQKEGKIFTGWIKEFFGLQQIDKNRVPPFGSCTEVLAVDETTQQTYTLNLFTEFSGIEKIEDNIYRPITNITINSTNQSSTTQQPIQLNTKIDDVYGIGEKFRYNQDGNSYRYSSTKEENKKSIKKLKCIS